MAKDKMAATTSVAAATPVTAANGKRSKAASTSKKGKRRERDADAAEQQPALAMAAAALRAEDDEDLDDVPMGEKAAAFAQANGAPSEDEQEDEDVDEPAAGQSGQQQAQQRSQGGATGSGLRDDEGFPAPGVSGRPTVDSVVMLLRQALRGEDAALLQKCLAVDEERTVKATVRQLGPDEVGSLLRLLTARLQTVQPGNKSALTWLQHTLVLHAGFVASAPGLQPVLAGMYEAIDSRLSTLPSLLSLSGRLNLLLAQLPAAGEEGAAQDAAAALLQPQVYMEESDPEDDGGVVVEDPFAPDLGRGGSDDENDSLLSGDDDDDDMDNDDDFDDDDD